MRRYVGKETAAPFIKVQKKGTVEMVTLAISEVQTWDVGFIVVVFLVAVLVGPAVTNCFMVCRAFTKLSKSIFHLQALNLKSQASMAASSHRLKATKKI